MSASLTETIGRIAGGLNLAREQMTDAMDLLMQGAATDEQIGLFLMALRAKGETVEEIAGAASSLRRHMTRIRSRRTALLDTCGTGGDRSGTFNISTASAIVETSGELTYGTTVSISIATSIFGWLSGNRRRSNTVVP